jgi:hypothetical protein
MDISWWTLLLIVIFIISLIFSFTIEEQTLKICFWLVMFLLALTIFNIALSIQYYIQLRNDPGIKGPRGPSGRKGAKGIAGVCSTDTECGTENCRTKIIEAVQSVYPEIDIKCFKDAQQCMSSDQKEKVLILQKEIDKLEAKCKLSTEPVNVFISKIKPQLEYLTGNGNAATE